MSDYEESVGDYEESRRSRRRSRKAKSAPAPAVGNSMLIVCVAVLAPAVMFVFGVLLGGFLHAISFQRFEGGSPTKTLLSPGLRQGSLPSRDNSSKKMIDQLSLADQKGCSGFPWKNLRLPRDVIPQSYIITIHPNITTNKMTGSVIIKTKVLKKTKLIVLHTYNIFTTSFNISVNSRMVNARTYVCPVWSQLAFVMDSEVKPGDVVALGIEYTGEVLQDFHGLYISTHIAANGSRTNSAVTQFEPISARKMFPCFDEPNLKATFELSVIRDPHHIVRSNMLPKISIFRSDGLYMDMFHRSVKMSTYLLAVAILEGYDYAAGITKNTRYPIEVRLYAPADVIKGQSEFAVDTTIKALEYFENYLNISYALAKMDVIALDDFSSGAMENWGMMTFRDSLLLAPDGSGSSSSAMVICHEVSHQWFGNLVTMDWWNDLWLNEGFASYTEFLCVDHLFPYWDIMEDFYPSNVAIVHNLDGLRNNSLAISTYSFTQTNPREMFNRMSYEKAAVILRMLHSFTGDQSFRRALNEYLNKYAYSTTKGPDLWKIINKHDLNLFGVSIRDVANAYITQVGCPMIYVSLSNTKITVHNQTRYFIEDGWSDNTKWPIPIYYRTDSQTEPRLQWMEQDRSRVSWKLKKRSKWVVANTGGLGYVKVLYDAKNYKELTKQFRRDHTAISATDRIIILTDTFDFAKSSKLHIKVYLNLLLYATEEVDLLVWDAINDQLGYISDLIEETAFAHIFRDFQLTLILRHYAKFGWNTHVPVTSSQRSLQVAMVRVACALRYRGCVQEAQFRYHDWMVNKKMPYSQFANVVMNEGVRHVGAAAWDRAFKRYSQARNPTEKFRMLIAMTSTTQLSLITRMLVLCLDGSSFRPNFVPFVFGQLSKTAATRALAWRFFRVNYNDFEKVLGERSGLVIRCVEPMIEKLSTKEDLEEVKAFFSGERLKYHKARLNQLFEQIELNIQWRRLNEEPLRRWLHDWDEKRRIIIRR